MSRKIIAIFTLFAICLTLFTGCANQHTGTVETPGNTEAGMETNTVDSENIIVIADTQCPTSLDLAQSWDSWYTSRWGITETLYKLDDNLEPQAFLAESCEMVDSNTWVITLRDDVTFQNGNKMTAESVQKCWERTSGINARFNELLYIESMTADGQVLTVRTSKAVPAFLNALCEPLTGIIDVTATEDPAVHPIGTGPFKAVSYEVKVRAEVEKYTAYWGGEPKVDGAVINIIGDTNTLALAQQNGESDISVSMPGTSLELFSDTSKYNVDGVPGSRGQIIFINFSNKFLQNKVIRQAISMAIDKESYAEILNKGASVAATGLYPDFMSFGADVGTEYDLEGAAQLLDGAGLIDTDGDGIRELDGENISLRLTTYSTKAELSNFCNEISSSAKKLGLDIQVEVYESVTDQEKTGDFDLLMVSFTMAPTGDPQYFADIAFKSGGSSNYGGYSNPEVDAAIAQLDEEFDPEKRVTLAKEIQDLIVEDVGFIVVGHAKYFYVMSADVKGLHTNPSEYYLLDQNVYIAE
jgi:peptide/nickel transport system substrate-binding protein